MRAINIAVAATLALAGCSADVESRKLPIYGYDERLEISTQRASGLLESEYDRVDVVSKDGTRTKLFEGEDAKLFNVRYVNENRSILITYCNGLVNYQQSRVAIHNKSRDITDVVLIQVVNSPAVVLRNNEEICART